LGSHTKEEHRLRVSEKKMLRRTFGPQREEPVGSWRRLHDEELCKIYYISPNILSVIKARKLTWAGHIALHGKNKKCVQNFGHKT
jgi:hypothetical protein